MVLLSPESPEAQEEAERKFAGKLLRDVGSTMNKIKTRSRPSMREHGDYKATSYNLQIGNDRLTYSIETPQDPNKNATIFTLNKTTAGQPGNMKMVEWQRSPAALGHKTSTTVRAYKGDIEVKDIVEVAKMVNEMLTAIKGYKASRYR